MLAKRSLVRGISSAWLLMVAVFVSGLQAEETSGSKLSIKADLVFSMLGPVRSNKYFPGDEIRYFITITGLEESEAGEVSFSQSVELQEENGESYTERPTSERTYRPALGKGSLFAGGFFQFPADTAPGKRKILITVRDKRNDHVQSVELPIEIVKPDGPYIVSPRYSTIHNGASPASGRFVVGDHVALNYTLLGLDALQGDYHCTCHLTFVEDGKVVGALKPLVIDSKSITPAPVQCYFHFSMDREFEGVARLELTNDLDDRKCVVELPLQISAPLKPR